ncbi:TPR repeat-containing protein [Calothrix sp. NIES-2100]|uniref:CHAT domain-containing protein n=1 Tax=Calothrix sp. NIES-2100 TaxID=1954172 RepID=UPI000B5F3A4F|nr:TPR repeat-containing protein [Calothrix sp. NIES-2100]
MLQSQEQLQIQSQSRILTLETIAFKILEQFCLALKNYNLTIQCLEQVRLIIQKLNNCRAEEKLILILANLYYLQGNERWKKSNILQALQSWHKCLDFREKMKNNQLEMLVWQALGNAYNYGFYNRSKAIEYLNESLKIANELRNEKIQGRLQGDLSAAYGALAVDDDNVVDTQKINQAINYAQSSLKIAQKYQDIEAECQALEHFGYAYFLNKEYKKAIKSYLHIFKIARQYQLPVAKIQALHHLGELYLYIKKYQKASFCFEWALKLAQQLQDAQQEAMGWVALGRVAKGQKNITDAINYYKKGIQIAEKIRSTLKIEENTTSFVNFWARHYRSLILLLWQEKHFEEAFEFVEQSKARAFLDKLANARIGLRGRVSGYLLKQEQNLRNQILSLRSKDPNHKLLSREKDYNNLLEKLEIQNPEIASLISVDVASLAEIQKELDTETTLLEYFVTDERTLVFIITRDRFQPINLDVTRAELKEQITLFLDFANISEHHPLELKNLYNYLIAPLKSYLPTPRLTIVPHNILHYLPFAALTDGERYLIDDYTLVNLPCANVLRFLRGKRSRSTNRILALGAPDNTFDKLLAPLNFAQKEVEAIACRFQTKAYIGKDATESLVWSQAKKAEILHIAAHGKYNPNTPLFSTIHLAMDDKAEVAQKDGRLEVHDVYKLDLTTSTNLVVLSACETFIGNTQKVSLGDEIIGLNRAFIYAGTPSVIASLWNVEDRATQSLMKKFYHYLKMGMDKAKALQQAQIAVRKNQPHPSYWAAFVLTGDAEKINL